jgi:hypothetical protein
MIQRNHFVILIGVSLFSLLLASSCRTTKNVSLYEIKPMTVSKILKKIEKETPSYRSYESKKVAIDFENNNLKTTISAQFSIQKNNGILLSAKKLTLPIAKVLVTPDSMKMINYLQKNYLIDDVASLKKIFNIDVDYELLQAVLTADVSNFLDNKNLEKEHSAKIDAQMYKIDSELASTSANELSYNPKKKNNSTPEFTNYSVWVDPQLFVIRKVVMIDRKKNETLTLNYDQFERIGRNLFPQQIMFEYNTPSKDLKLDLKLSKPTVNNVKDFNFVIPDKFEKFKLSRN